MRRFEVYSLQVCGLMYFGRNMCIVRLFSPLIFIFLLSIDLNRLTLDQLQQIFNNDKDTSRSHGMVLNFIQNTS